MAGVRVPTSALLHLDAGRRELAVEGPGRFLLLGGTPFDGGPADVVELRRP